MTTQTSHVLYDGNWKMMMMCAFLLYPTTNDSRHIETWCFPCRKSNQLEEKIWCHWRHASTLDSTWRISRTKSLLPSSSNATSSTNRVSGRGKLEKMDGPNDDKTCCVLSELLLDWHFMFMVCILRRLFVHPFVSWHLMILFVGNSSIYVYSLLHRTFRQ